MSLSGGEATGFQVRVSVLMLRFLSERKRHESILDYLPERHVSGGAWRIGCSVRLQRSGLVSLPHGRKQLARSWPFWLLAEPRCIKGEPPSGKQRERAFKAWRIGPPLLRRLLLKRRPS